MDPRRLVIRMVEISAQGVEAYLADAARRADRARADGAHFWLFRAEGPVGNRGRYVEFTESREARSAGDPSASAAHTGAEPAESLRWPGDLELHCTEVPLPAAET